MSYASGIAGEVISPRNRFATYSMTLTTHPDCRGRRPAIADVISGPVMIL